jgi:two-component system KDP operon response regulator KdpE
MKRTCILVVDDDLLVVKYLRANLSLDGYSVLTALDGNEALHVVEKELPDLIILDIRMPGIDGFEVCQRIREWSQVPILILSVLTDENDKVKCLDAGADDYLEKPFGINELSARIRALLRRSAMIEQTPQHTIFSQDDLKVNFAQRKVSVGNHEITLTHTEYCLLTELVLNSGKVLTHTYLLEKIWGPEYNMENQYLHVYIRRLRRKIENDPSDPHFIITIPGVGYQFSNSLTN